MVGWFFFGYSSGPVWSGLVWGFLLALFLSVFHDPRDFVWSITSFYYYYLFSLYTHTFREFFRYPREYFPLLLTCYGCHVMVGEIRIDTGLL